MRFQVLSYNIHKGFNLSGTDFVLGKIRERIRSVGPDLVFLQEVLGHHTSTKSQISDWHNQRQFEFLADELWSHYAYGMNAIYTSGHHGNAILSKFPIEQHSNIDLTVNQLEKRGVLWSEVKDPESGKAIYAFCMHLNLFEADRLMQAELVCQEVLRTVPPDSPLIIAGDFNDWRRSISQIFRERLGVQEAFVALYGTEARTFPAPFPLMRLDRVYFRGLQPVRAEVLRGPEWRTLSDHLPLVVEFEG